MIFRDFVVWSDLAPRLGLTLAHSIWQGLAVAALLGIALRAFRSTSPQVRYVASLGGLALLLATSVSTFVMTAPGASRQPIAQGDIPGAFSSALPNSIPVPESPSSPRPGESAPRQSLSVRALRPALPWITLAWCIGVVILGLWRLGGWVAVQRLRSLDAQQLDSEEIASRLADRLARRLQLTGPFRLARSLRVRTPLLIGWLRPLILLPAAVLSGLSPQQLESILAHELVHVRRHDYLINLLQIAVETLLFYHPAVWWISWRVRLEREQCCDDIAVAICGGDRCRYVESLAAVEEIRLSSSPQHLLAMAALGSGGAQLLARIRRLLQPRQELRRNSPAGAAFCAVLVVALALGLLRQAPRPSAAQAADERAAASSTSAAKAPAQRLQFRLVAEQSDAEADTDIVTGADKQPLRVRKTALIDERDLARAYPTKTADGDAAVGIEFTTEGARRFEKLTSANIGRRLAIIFDGKLISAPTIRSTMSKSAIITPGRDGFTADQVLALWEALPPAAAPAPAQARSPTRNTVEEALAELEILKLEANDFRVQAAEIQALAKRAEYQRIQKLHEQGSAPDSEVEKARAELDLAQVQIAQEKQDLAVKLAKVKKQELLLDRLAPAATAPSSAPAAKR
jgi:beta-lactamase regulating signal transducer with metallopeptidase domain